MTIFQTTKETPVFNRRRNPCFQSSAKPLFSIVGKTPVLGRRQNGRFSRQRTFFFSTFDVFFHDGNFSRFFGTYYATIDDFYATGIFDNFQADSLTNVFSVLF